MLLTIAGMLQFKPIFLGQVLGCVLWGGGAVIEGQVLQGGLP